MDSKLKEIFENHLAKPNESLYKHTFGLLENFKTLKELGYVSDSIAEMLELACQYHDIGKLNPRFAKRLLDGKKFNAEEEAGHNILSAYLSSYYIDLYKEEKDIVINAILNHHHYIENYTYIINNKPIIDNNLVSIYPILEIGEKEQRSIIGTLGNRKIGMLKKNRLSSVYIKVKGLLNKCDYAASAHIDCELENNFLESSLSGLGYKWNKMQSFCKDNSDSNLIIIGSTGLGKTEASLLWAGDSKIFYVLPLRTAINAMYGRIKNDIVRTNIEDRVGLLHGDTASVYLQDDKYNNSDEIEESLKFFNYYDRTRSMSLPITVATPDQLFDFVFKYPGYELKLATFSYSKIIIDEIQAYSPDILAYTILAIKRINTLGGKFALFTATLAPFVRDLLLEEKSGEVPIEYKEESFLSKDKRHVMKVVEDEISSAYIFDVINNIEMKTGLIVMNTVKDAQRMYGELKDLFEDDEGYEINLLHAKFTRKDRKEKEKAILEDGDLKNRGKKTKKKIWVATQIVEASLDIDFDILFTELSELLGFFQRMGRCFRKREKQDLIPNVYVFTEINEKYLTRTTESDSGFIDRGLYFLSKEALLEKGNGLLDEEAKLSMINEYFTTERIEGVFNNNFIDKYRKTVAYIDSINLEQLPEKEVIKRFRNIVSFKAIPLSVNIGSINDEKSIGELKDEIEEVLLQMKNSSDENERKKLRIKLIKTKDKLEDYILNVEYYLVNLNNYIQVGNDKYFIIDNEYDKEYGLIKNKENSLGSFLW